MASFNFFSGEYAFFYRVASAQTAKDVAFGKRVDFNFCKSGEFSNLNKAESAVFSDNHTAVALGMCNSGALFDSAIFISLCGPLTSYGLLSDPVPWTNFLSRKMSGTA